MSEHLLVDEGKLASESSMKDKMIYKLPPATQSVSCLALIFK